MGKGRSAWEPFEKGRFFCLIIIGRVPVSFRGLRVSAQPAAATRVAAAGWNDARAWIFWGYTGRGVILANRQLYAMELSV
jgi:hypothetical protein